MITSISEDSEYLFSYIGFWPFDRKERFDRVCKDLKVTRVFSTLVEEMKKIGCAPSKGESKFSHTIPPSSRRDRRPVLLLMGGGMGAGKSTVLKDICKECVILI